MNDDPVVTELRRAMTVVSAGHHLDRGTVDAALARLETHPSPRRRRGYLVAAAAAVVALTAALVYVLLPSPTSHRAAAPSGGSGCRDVVTTLLPTWARSGFTRRGLHTPHVVGARGRILAVLFGPLHSPPPQQEANKILWVPRGAGGGPLVIHARLLGSGRTARWVVPNGPGPSYVNMPSPGCWHFSLSWPAGHDLLDIRYSP